MQTTAHSDILERKSAGAHFISVDKLRPSRYQTRHLAFDDANDIERLAESIRSIGMIEIPIVRRVSEGEDEFFFEIISGHRRIHAVTKYLGWKQVKCKVYDDIDEFTALSVALTENIQRSNLSPYEEGMSYVTCQRIFGLSDSQIAEQLHRSVAAVVSRKQLAKSANNCLRYLSESDKVLFLRNYTFGHHEALSEVKDSSQIRELVYLIKDGITIKELKSIIAHSKTELTAKEEERGEISISPRIRGRSNKAQLVSQLRSEIERLKEEAPDGFRSRIYLLEDMFDEIQFLDKHAKIGSHLSSLVQANRGMELSREFSCPSCGKMLKVERYLNEKEKSVSLVIRKPEGQEASPSIISFPKLP